LIRRGYGINIAHLFKARGSIYWYTYGVNWRAFVAWFVALAPLLPGMLNSMGVTITNQSILNMYSWNYVLVVAFSGSIYWALGAIWPFPVHSDGAYDTGALYLIEGLEPEGLMTSDLVEKGEKRGTPESEKTTLQSSALPHVLDSREKKS
jgi:NCS1 family nucleobase:cation symporter-1